MSDKSHIKSIFPSKIKSPKSPRSPISPLSTTSSQNNSFISSQSSLDVVTFEKFNETYAKISTRIQLINHRAKQVRQNRELAEQVISIRSRHISSSKNNKLRREVEKQRQLLLEKRKCVDKRRLNLEKACHIIKQDIQNNRDQDQKFLQAYENYNHDRQELQSLERRLRLRQHKICRQLLHIFPFRPMNRSTRNNNKLVTTDYCIRHVTLPQDMEKLLQMASRGSNIEEEMCIGLGYIAHLVVLLSKYLQIPLRHDIESRGSRSKIVDCFHEAEAFKLSLENKKNKRDPDYPLYSKGIDKQRFQRGIELLRENINQLCTQCQFQDYKTNHFIHNIRTVLYRMALVRL